MGEENDLKVIHDNLSRQLNREKNDSQNNDLQKNKIRIDEQRSNEQIPKTPTQQDIFDARLPAGEGIQFYDPRHPEKYWTSPTAHFKTMGAAMEALAAQYGMDASWIENHMGSINDLNEIHHTIRRNLQKQLNQSK